MDIKTELLKPNTEQEIVSFTNCIGNNAYLFNQLVELFLTSEYRLNQRAAEPIYRLTIQHPTLICPHLKKLISILNTPNQAEALCRNILRVLQNVTIPKRLHAATLNSCFLFLSDNKSPIAVKVFAMTVAANISVNYPTVKAELTLIVEDLLQHGSPGIQSRGKKILAKLNGKTI